MGLTWSPLALPWIIIGAGLVAAWLILSPPRRRSGVRGLLRVAAATLLLATIFDAGWRRSADGRGTVSVVVDRSRSMSVAGESGSRSQAARAWMDASAFADWTAGWDVVIDSFGGATSDVAAAIEVAASRLPDAIVIVSDGRAVDGRSAEPPSVPLFAYAPGPVTVSDAAVTRLWIDGDDLAVVEVAAVGGEATAGAGTLELRVDGAVIATRAVPPLGPGERHELRIPLETPPRVAIVEALVAVDGDPVQANDRRLALLRAEDGVRRTLVVGLRPGWDLAPFLRALRETATNPVDAFLGDGETLRPIGSGSGPNRWPQLQPDRYGVVYLFGDPAALGAAGTAWVDAFARTGGTGLYWAPGGAGGRLPGAGVTIPDGDRAAGSPVLTDEGRAWLIARGMRPGEVPDGSGAWPPLEHVPARRSDVGAGATVLLGVGERPAVWIDERRSSRIAVALGIGYYRWPVGSAVAGDAAGATFWSQWVEAITRWLSAATPEERLGLRMPAGSRVDRDGRLEAHVASGTDDAIDWHVWRGADQATGEIVERGRLDPGASPRSIVVGPFEPGLYGLGAEAAQAGWAVSEPFVVDAVSRDLVTTAADTVGLAAAARASGGAVLSSGSLPPLPMPSDRSAFVDAAVTSAGASPWPLLVAVALLLADWALALARRDHAG